MFHYIGFNTLWNIDASHMKWPIEWAVLVLLFQHFCRLVLWGRSYTPISCPTQSLHWLLWCRTLLSEEGAPQWRAVSMVTPGCMNGSLGNCGQWHLSILHWHCRTIPIQSSQPYATHLLSKLFWVSNCTSNSGCFLSFWEVSKNDSILEANACCAF